MKFSDKIYVAGHTGLVGSALVRVLRAAGYHNLVLRTHAELNLCHQQSVDCFFREERPAYVFVAAARVGGIAANSLFPADFLYDNLMITAHIIEAAHRYDVEKLLYLGSSCIYPRDVANPIVEQALLTGPLETTNEWYALAKIAGLKLCQAYMRQYGRRFIAAMPTNVYGVGDTFDALKSHVIPALIMKCVEAHERGDATFTVWGSGRPRREFLYVDDLAEALLMLMVHYEEDLWINVGSGHDYTIAEIGTMIAGAVGYEGTLRFDTTMPDGVMRKLIDSSRIQELGWSPRVSLEEGLAKTVAWYRTVRCSRTTSNHEEIYTSL